MRGARGRLGGVGAGAGYCVFPVSPFPPRVSRAVCGGPSRPGVPYPRSLVRHSMRSVRSAGSVGLPFRFSPRVLCVCVRSCSRGPRAPPPLRVGVARARRAVPTLGAGRAVPRGPCPSVCPASVPCSVWLAWGGAAWSRFPLPGLELRTPRGVGAGVGTRYQPYRARSCELALRAVGAARGCLGGAPLAWVWGVQGSGALPAQTTRPFGRAAGAHYPLAVVAWGAGVGTSHQPHSARSCELALRAVEAARGRPQGRLLPGFGASGVRRSPSPDHSSFRACGRGPLPTGCGCGGCGRGDPSPTPQRALLPAGFARCGGGMRVPGGGASCLGARDCALSRPRQPVLWGVRPGPTTHWLWVRGVRAWGPVTNPTARALASWLCAPGRGARGRPGEGRLLPGCWASGVGQSPIPDHPSFGACGRGPLPTGCGCGGCGRGDPSPTPQRALLRSALARCGGGMRGPGGGRLLPGCGVRRSLPPDHSSSEACGRGPPCTGCGCGGCECWDPSPTPQRVLLRAGLARCGCGRRVSGGAPRAWVWGVRGRALSHPRPLVLSGVRPGPTSYWLCLPGVWAWGPFTNPTARALANWFCVLWGRHKGAREGHLLPGVGRPGFGALPPPATRPFGRADGAHYPLAWVRGMRAWGPITNPTARAPVTWLCALWGRHEGARRGRLLPRCGAPGVGRFSHRRPLGLSGVRPGPPTHWLWVRGVRAWGPVTNPTARALASWLCALWGAA